MYEYAYWKCYYAAGATSFKAAELYSVDVDYFTFGSCRLVHGAYYCGRFSATAPYKGLVDTLEHAHVASDVLVDHMSRPLTAEQAPPTGTRVHDPRSPSANERKLQRPFNPSYYQKRHAGGGTYAYTTGGANNGQRTSATSHTSTAYGGTGVFNAGYHAGAHVRHAEASATSNYATDRGVAERVYGVGDGGGPHVVESGYALGRLPPTVFDSRAVNA